MNDPNPVSNLLEIIWEWMCWSFWKYLGVMSLLMAIPIWPWIIYMLYNNENNENGACLINWHRKPRSHNHTEWLLHAPVNYFKDTFDFGIDCICHE